MQAFCVTEGYGDINEIFGGLYLKELKLQINKMTSSKHN